MLIRKKNQQLFVFQNANLADIDHLIPIQSDRLISV